jgi:hypothetical protein
MIPPISLISWHLRGEMVLVGGATGQELRLSPFRNFKLKSGDIAGDLVALRGQLTEW